jgi:chitin disaccharide deacetylase
MAFVIFRKGVAMSTSASLTNRLLGYPDDARLLIINADDFGMCHAVNEGIFQSLQEGIVQSTSLMMPCPWALHALRLLEQNPQIFFGIHLTLICEAADYKWRPLVGKERIPSLLHDTGHFYDLVQMADLLAKAELEEVELEFRAQIETVLQYEVNPTHVDWHCLRNGGREDIFDLSVRLAREYGLAVRVYDPHYIRKTQIQNLPTNDHPLLDSYRVDIPTKFQHYTTLLRALPNGLSEWAVHPGHGTPELRALEPEGWQVRQTDLEFLISAEARETIQQEGIILLNYEPLQQVWKRSVQ